MKTKFSTITISNLKQKAIWVPCYWVYFLKFLNAKTKAIQLLVVHFYRIELCLRSILLKYSKWRPRKRNKYFYIIKVEIVCVLFEINVIYSNFSYSIFIFLFRFEISLCLLSRGILLVKRTKLQVCGREIVFIA